jgi:nephrocystin-4
LVSSWNVVLHSTAPSITKSFEISIPRGKAVSKRVSYKNPYAYRKVLYLRTDQPYLVQFKEEVLELDAGATQYIGMKFAPCSNVAATSVLIFLNDESDSIEECLQVRVVYHS